MDAGIIKQEKRENVIRVLFKIRKKSPSGENDNSIQEL
jgi:hypothetical protein